MFAAVCCERERERRAGKVLYVSKRNSSGINLYVYEDWMDGQKAESSARSECERGSCNRR